MGDFLLHHPGLVIPCSILLGVLIGLLLCYDWKELLRRLRFRYRRWRDRNKPQPQGMSLEEFHEIATRSLATSMEELRKPSVFLQGFLKEAGGKSDEEV